MALRDTELVETGTAAVSSAQNRPDDDQSISNADVRVGIKREKLLKTMFICSSLAAVLSLAALVVGSIAFASFGDDLPYSMGGCALAGGMALVFTICPCCLYCERKKTKTGTKMTSTFRCCYIGMMVWFSFSLCGILMAMGISGIWGMVECLKVKQNPDSDIFKSCLDRTDEKFAISVLSLILPTLLLILSLVIICIFGCNTRTFGYKTVQQRRYDFYRSHFREESEQEQQEQTNQWQPQTREFRAESPREPSAPPLDVIGGNRDQRPYYERDHPRGRPHDSDGRRNRPKRPRPESDAVDGNRDQWPNHGRDHPRGRPHDSDGRRNRPRRPRPESEQRRRDERDREQGIETEEPPPSYDEVVNKYLKADDV